MPEITYGRWNPTEVWDRVFDGTWVSADDPLGGMVLITPTSIASTGTGNSSSIGANGSVTFSACETLSLNGVFTTSYDNYMIAMRTIGSVANFPSFRLRSAGIDESSASNFYTHQYIYAGSTTVSAARSANNLWYSYGNTASLYSGHNMNIYGPFLAQPTAHRTLTVDARDSATVSDYAGTHSLSNSYDGITIFPNTGSMMGIISVYGLGG